jgi:hypothetical protein
VGTDPARILRRFDWLCASSVRWRRFSAEFQVGIPGEDRAAEQYESQWRNVAGPCVRYVHGTFFDDGVLAACLAFQTVVVADPMSLLPGLYAGAPESFSHVESTQFYIRFMLTTCHLSELIPLVEAGILVFDSTLDFHPRGWKGRDPSRRESQIFDAMPESKGGILGARTAYWAVIEARSHGAAVGSSDPDYRDSLLNWGRAMGYETPAAIEVPILLPYVERTTPTGLVAIRRKHADALAQFRAAIGLATLELTKLPERDLTAGRVRQLTRDYIDGEMAKLDREWRAVRIYRGAAAATGVGALVSAAVVIGVTGANQANALLPLFAGTSSLASAAAALGIDSLRLKANSMYVLWKVGRR